jgi:hypothetical protein
MDWKLGLNFYSPTTLLFNPNDIGLKEVINTIKREKYHIYLVCKRKKLFFDRCWKDLDGSTKIQLYWLDEKHEKKYIGFKDTNDLWINSCENGMCDINLKEVKNHRIRDYAMVNIMFSSFMQEIDAKTPLISDLEVMYVGQAFGRKKRRMIDYRLVNHEKIQRVALEVLDRGSNEEVLVIGQKVQSNDFATLFVPSNPEKRKISGTADNLYGLKNKAAKRITEGQQVTVFEASLIRYFQPALNTEHKQSFPSPDFDSYDEIFQTDFDYCSFGLDTHKIHTRLFSQHVTERLFVHSQHFPLKTKSDKKSLFEFLLESSGFGGKDIPEA